MLSFFIENGVLNKAWSGEESGRSVLLGNTASREHTGGPAWQGRELGKLSNVVKVSVAHSAAAVVVTWPLT